MKNNYLYKNLDYMEASHAFFKGRQGHGIFYRSEDFIVFITIVSVTVRKMNLTVLAFCPMFNRVHILFKEISRKALGIFIRLSCQTFVREYNREYERKGPLLHKSFGHSIKKGIKIILGCVAYVFNNPVAGRLVESAIDYRWNLLAYKDNKNPFSKPFNKKTCSYTLRKALSKIDFFYNSGNYVGYSSLRNIMEGLDKEETSRAVDYLITRYNFLSFDSLDVLYGGFDNLLIALKSNAGAEFDMEDEYGDHSCYRTMLKLVIALGYTGKKLNFENLARDKTMALYHYIKLKTRAPVSCVCKFLHIESLSDVEVVHY